jgi:AraC-like DNA-binding protein
MARIVTNAGLGRVTLSGLLRKAGNTGMPNMRVFGSYAAVFCFEGRGYYEDTSGLRQDIVPGDMILVFPELGHRYGPRPGQFWSEFYLVFEGPVVDLWRKSGFLDSTRPVHHLEPVDYWHKQFQSVLGPDRTPGLAPAVLEICRLQQVLAEALLSEEMGAISPHDLDWVSRARTILEGDLDRQRPMPAVAKKLAVSYESFRKRFTRIVGLSPARYRDARIIDQARRLMQEEHLSNKEIADRLGFCDEFHFSHRFKQITGKSPRKFRASLPEI